MKHNLIIIGGGAAGIMAAITAKDMGCDVAILEGNDRIGKKILTTGNGRCNITNKCADKTRYHSENNGFYTSVLEEFNVEKTIDFFNSLGLPLVTLDDGKMYPMSLQASSVLDILRFTLEDRGIPVYLNTKVKNIIKKKDSFQLVGNDSMIYEANKIILACGGKSAPKTGSDGSGFSLAKALGHNIVPAVPALVQLKLDYKNLKALSGIKLDGLAQIIIDDICQRKEFGEVLFTDYGISGPPILQLSRNAAYSLSKSHKVTLSIDMMPNHSTEELSDFLENHWAAFFYRSVVDSLIGIINKKLIPILLKEANVSNIHKPCNELDWREKKNIISLLKGWQFKVYETNSFSNSQVTAGGIDTSQVHSKTLESKIIPNVYFAGEILDVDGDCGGFNLQWAWSSGYAAAKAASV
ncbi:MAG: NAD(P)/FAD-dependent oxidoreductase [Bacillota bacterium]|nr:NAD(P)/FAD-dependent oxidoreductase [Bacillota bacterium]